MSQNMKEGLEKLIESVSASTPTPGGGAVSALSGALSASLCDMVVGLTVGKKRFNEYPEDIQQRIHDIGTDTARLKGVFLTLFHEDNGAYEEVMKAMKLPKETEEQKSERAQKMDEAMVLAMEVPFRTANTMIGFYPNIQFICEYGNPNCLSDAAVASLQALSCIRGSIFNVGINASGIRDRSLAEDRLAQCEGILKRAEDISQSILARVEERMKNA